MLITCIKGARKLARTYKIKDRMTNVIVWSPILIAVYMNVALLTYRYSREDSNSDSILD